MTGGGQSVLLKKKMEYYIFSGAAPRRRGLRPVGRCARGRRTARVPKAVSGVQSAPRFLPGASLVHTSTDDG